VWRGISLLGTNLTVQAMTPVLEREKPWKKKKKKKKKGNNNNNNKKPNNECV
jgi:hypothetical protein